MAPLSLFSLLSATIFSPLTWPAERSSSHLLPQYVRLLSA